MASSTNSTTSTFQVQLAVYDLAQGMARSLLGGNTAAVGGIDVIPHTGLVVYGREYFFGSGIQSEDPLQFRQSTGLQPLLVRTLGRTAVTRTAFEAWCVAQARAGTYSATSYDLLQRNCNNFSFDAATQCLGVPADMYPAWILEVPRRFLSSPLGQMLRPMLENMRITHPAGAEPVLGTTATTSGSTTIPELIEPQADDEQPNPWANIPAKKATSKPAAIDDSTLRAENGNQHDANSTTTATATASTRPTLDTPLLDSFTQPLLSNDTKTVGICIQKLILACNKDDDEDKTINNSYKETLEQAGSRLKQPQTLTLQNAKHARLTLEQSESVAAILLHVLQHVAPARTFALLLLRIVVLHYCRQPPGVTATPCLMTCLDWVQSALTNSSSSQSDDCTLPSAAARSTAWLVSANAVAAGGLVVLLDDDNNNDAHGGARLVDAAVQDAAHERPEVRQAATAFLYNAVLLRGPKLSVNNDNEEMVVSDAVVGILCTMLERVGGSATDEADVTTRLRALLVLGRILKPASADGNVVCCEAAKQLVLDLGLTDALLPLGVERKTNKKGVDDQVQTLASELLRIVQQ